MNFIRYTKQTPSYYVYITNKHHPIMYTYQLIGHPLIWSPVIRYLGVYISSSLKWTDHCSHIAKIASNTLNYIRHAMFTCTSAARSVAYKCLVRPQLEYACQVWNPHLIKDILMLEAVQKRAARWIHSKWYPNTFTWSKTTEAVCKNFAGQALLEDVIIYVLLSCLTFYIRGILYHLILIVHSSLLHI